jgi:CelD/BcsL family acetyltransferase involved in cellulose biosynthesis
VPQARSGLTAMSYFSTELVTTLEDFEALKAPWNELVAAMEFPEIFYLWEWNFHYFRHYREGSRLSIVVVRHSSGRLAGIAPFCVSEVRRLGCRARVVDTIVAEIGDYQNILVHAAYHRGRVVAAVLGCLREQSRLWDVIDISQLCSRDPTTFHIVNVAQTYTDWSVRVQTLTPVAVRRLKGGRAVEKTRQIRQIRNRRTALADEGFTMRVGCTDLAELWPVFKSLHRHAWRNSPLNTPHGRSFFDELTQSEGMRGRIELSYMEFQGQPVAMHFGFVDSRKVYYYMPAMDRSFRQERAGAVLLSAIVDHYAGTHDVFDFLRGMEDYKVWYTDDLDMNMRIVAYRTASFAAFVYNLRESIRRFAVDLGLPKAAAQAARRIMARLSSPP